MNKHLKIAMIITRLAKTAPINIAKEICEFCLKKGHEVMVFYFDECNENNFNCPTAKININKPIDFDDFDIIHSHMYRPDKYVAKFSNIIKKARTVSTLHCIIEEDLYYTYGRIVSYIYNKIWLYYLSKFNVVAQISPYSFDYYIKTLPNSKLICNGVKINHEKITDIDILKKLTQFRNMHNKIICSYSNIIKRKGLLQILEVLKNRKDLSYICVGEGNQKQYLMKYCKDNGIDKQVLFLPFIDKPYNILNYSDIFIMPSYSEGMGLGLIEAGFKRKSAVVSNIPVFKSIFNDAEVTYFELDNCCSLSEAIDMAIKYKSIKGEAIFNKVSNMYNEKIMLENYETLYQKLVSNE